MPSIKGNGTNAPAMEAWKINDLVMFSGGLADFGALSASSMTMMIAPMICPPIQQSVLETSGGMGYVISTVYSRMTGSVAIDEAPVRAQMMYGAATFAQSGAQTIPRYDPAIMGTRIFTVIK